MAFLCADFRANVAGVSLRFDDMTAYVVHVLAVPIQRTAIAKSLFTDVTLKLF